MKYKKVILVFCIIFIFILLCNIYESYENTLNFNRIYMNLTDEIRSDCTVPISNNLSNYRSKYLYNYLFNYSRINNISKFTDLTIKDYLNKICFVEDFSLTESILTNTNTFLKEYYDYNEIINNNMLISDFIKIIKNLMKLKFKEDIKLNLNYDIKCLNNYIIFDSVIHCIIDIIDENYYLQNIKDAILNFLYDNNVLTYITRTDYDDFDILFEAIDKSILDRINNNLNCKYSTILNLSLNEVNNLFYSGLLNVFNYNMDFCK